MQHKVAPIINAPVRNENLQTFQISLYLVGQSFCFHSNTIDIYSI